MTKILMVTHYFDSHHGGIEIVARNVFEGLAKEKCQMTWAAADTTPPNVEGQYKKSIPLKTWNWVERAIGVPFPVPMPRSAGQLAAEVKRNDLVLLHDCLYLSNIAAFLSARFRKKPVIIVQHIGMVPYRNPVLRLMMKVANRTITRPMLARASQVVFISEVTRRYFETVRFRRTPVIIFNGVDTEVFRPIRSREEKSALRGKLELPVEGRVALFVGRFVEKKGLRILQEMVRQSPEVLWAFAGSGPMDPSQWNLPNVRTYTSLKGKAIADLYRACDVLALPSVGEGLPLVVQEALACGLPVICGDETATADPELRRVVTGVNIVNGDDALSATAFLAAMRSNSDEGTALRAAERHDFARLRYSWKSAMVEYLRVISTLMPSEERLKEESEVYSHAVTR